MADEPMEPVEPELTLEEQTEQDILAQPDAREMILKDVSDGVENIIWTARESARLGKRVTTVHEYYDLVDDKGKLIGRQRWRESKHVTEAGHAVPVNALQIIGSRKRGK